jgi:hypothetical protein
MKVIAYIAASYRYFGDNMPRAARDFDLTPFPLYENLLKMGKETTPEDFALFWDCLLEKERFDALWSYARPDEITVQKCAERGIPVLIQEYYGHHPKRISAIAPLRCDWEKVFPPNEEDIAAGPRPKARPVITVTLSEGGYSKHRTISRFIHVYDGANVPLHPFWFPCDELRSYADFVKMILSARDASPVLKECEIRLRPHPRYPQVFQNEIGLIEKLGDPAVTVDRTPLADSLAGTDIIINVNSNHGFDGLRAGKTVITFNDRAFYANPCLTLSPMTPAELARDLEKAAVRLMANGTRPIRFIRRLERMLEGPLSYPCIGQPEDESKLKNAVELAASLPLIR